MKNKCSYMPSDFYAAETTRKVDGLNIWNFEVIAINCSVVVINLSTSY